MSLIILFGPTGAGKTYLGKLLQKEFGYYFYDGDADLTEEMKQALNSMRPITGPMRDRFFKRLLKSIDRLQKRHKRLVIGQTFIKEKYRVRVKKAQFILVKTKARIRHQRRRQLWSQNYLKQMDGLFETPKIPHRIITNDKNGSAHLIKKLRSLLSGL